MPSAAKWRATTVSNVEDYKWSNVVKNINYWRLVFRLVAGIIFTLTLLRIIDVDRVARIVIFGAFILFIVFESYIWRAFNRRTGGQDPGDRPDPF